MHQLGARAGYRGRSETLDDPNARAFRERRAKEQEAAERSARAPKERPQIGGKFEHLPIARAADRANPRYGDPRLFPKTNRNW